MFRSRYLPTLHGSRRRAQTPHRAPCEDAAVMPVELPVPTVVEWYDHAARDLPWRAAGVPPWAVLVSEIMLQQTPVARVRPVYEAWLQRWPTPEALAADSPGDAVRMWGKLGYPRRALRL